MAKATRKTIDWDAIPIMIDSDTEPNASNPYASCTQEERERALAEVARRILLRRVTRIISN
jgi:hypothetical protein